MSDHQELAQRGLAKRAGKIGQKRSRPNSSVLATCGLPSGAVPTVHRSTVKRVDDLDRFREVEQVRLQEARDRLQRLQQEAAAAHATAPPVGVPNAIPEVAHLRVMVSQLQAQLAKCEGGLAGQALDGVIQESPTKKRPRPECFVSHTAEELIEYMMLVNPTCVLLSKWAMRPKSAGWQFSWQRGRHS